MVNLVVTSEGSVRYGSNSGSPLAILGAQSFSERLLFVKRGDTISFSVSFEDSNGERVDYGEGAFVSFTSKISEDFAGSPVIRGDVSSYDSGVYRVDLLVDSFTLSDLFATLGDNEPESIELMAEISISPSGGGQLATDWRSSSTIRLRVDNDVSQLSDINPLPLAFSTPPSLYSAIYSQEEEPKDCDYIQIGDLRVNISIDNNVSKLKYNVIILDNVPEGDRAVALVSALGFILNRQFISPSESFKFRNIKSFSDSLSSDLIEGKIVVSSSSELVLSLKGGASWRDHEGVNLTSKMTGGSEGVLATSRDYLGLFPQENSAENQIKGLINLGLIDPLTCKIYDKFLTGLGGINILELKVDILAGQDFIETPTLGENSIFLGVSLDENLLGSNDGFIYGGRREGSKLFLSGVPNETYVNGATIYYVASASINLEEFRGDIVEGESLVVMQGYSPSDYISLREEIDNSLVPSTDGLTFGGATQGNVFFLSGQANETYEGGFRVLAVRRTNIPANISTVGASIIEGKDYVEFEGWDETTHRVISVTIVSQGAINEGLSYTSNILGGKFFLNTTANKSYASAVKLTYCTH